ncbi:MAG: hypothetical protein AAFV29_07865 [Myxococcota bacterium]
MAGISIAVWLLVFPMMLQRGPAGAFSGEEGGFACFAGGESHADTDLVRFMRRFHYLGIRAEVKTGKEGELCFILRFSRRLSEAVPAVLRTGRLQAFTVPSDQSSLFPPDVAKAAGLVHEPEAQLGPTWSATSTTPVAMLIERRRHELPGPAFVYCRYGRCTGVLAKPDLVVAPTDVMAAFPIRAENEEPTLLMRLSPPALQRITALAKTQGGPVPMLFAVDGHAIAVTAIPAPEADGQVRVPLDKSHREVEIEAAILAALLSSGPLDGDWKQTELRLTAAKTP